MRLFMDLVLADTCFYKPREVNLSKLYSPIDDNIIDHALTIYFKSPNSYTGEDVVEFHTHGSKAVISELFDNFVYISNNFNIRLRQAEKGEFTRRAYYSGKFNLTQVEAIRELIASNNQIQKKNSILKLNNNLYNLYEKWMKDLTGIIARVEGSIDFQEESCSDIILKDSSVIRNLLNDLLVDIKSHINNKKEEIVDGIKLLLMGPPNSGKSSFVNNLFNEDISIVSNVPGTTRDLIRVNYKLKELNFQIIDTAGVRTISSDTKNDNEVIELIGINKAIGQIKSSRIILFIFDPLNIKDSLYSLNRLFSKFNEDNESDKLIYILIGKIDLIDDVNKYHEMISDFLSNLSEENKNVSNIVSNVKVFNTCSLNQSSVNCIMNEVNEDVNKYYQLDSNSLFINEQRHKSHLNKIIKFIQQILDLIDDNKVDLEIISEYLRQCVYEIEYITGERTNDYILDEIFNNFCIGNPQPRTQKKPIGVDIGEKESSNEFFYTEQDGNGYYRPKGNYVFDLIKIGGVLSTFTDKYDKVLWKSNDPKRYAKLVVIDKIGYFSEPEHISVFYSNEEVVHLVKLGKIYLKEQTLIDVDLKKTQSTYEYLVRQYEITTFVPRFNFRFKSVAYGNIKIWQARNELEYATSVEFSGNTAFSGPSNINVFLDCGNMLHYIKSGKGYIKVTPKVILDLSKRYNTIDIEFTHMSKVNSCVFEAKGEFVIKEVIDTNYSSNNNFEDIWDCKNGYKCAKKAVLKTCTEVGDYLGLYLTDGTLEVFHQEDKGKPWVKSTCTALLSDINTASMDLSTPRHINKAISLHANRMAGKYHSVNNNIFSRTCTYKTFEGSSFSALFIDDVEVWRSHDKELLASKVIMKTDGRNDVYAVVLLDNGGFLLFNRVNLQQPWVDISASRYDVLNIKMIGLDPRDHTKVAELDPSMYFLKTEFISYVIQFHKGVKCIEIQYMNKTVWTFKKKYPLKFLYNIRTNKAYVFYNEDKFSRLNF
ncbi:tRNA modification GTPase [Theileria orientalis]|uniref:tRNA modification GTPase n=1 Tax=Theileria orientalis TaxID=68886 RepID=A0A976QU14_THEOR|nr:tRNA modification GTPase [Theileria orientalis]